jgi:TPR repeat protein
MYERYGTVEPDDEDALKWLRKAAEQGHAKAQRELGRWYASGRGVRASFEEAEKWFRRAAAQGDSEAVENLRQMPELPELTKKAKQGNVRAQRELVHRYGTGFLVERNQEEAAKWCRKLAEQGERDAQWRLGCLYQDGDGVERNDEEAAKWLEKAAAQEDKNAEEALRELYERCFLEHMKRSLLARKRPAG